MRILTWIIVALFACMLAFSTAHLAHATEMATSPTEQTETIKPEKPEVQVKPESNPTIPQWRVSPFPLICTIDGKAYLGKLVSEGYELHWKLKVNEEVSYIGMINKPAGKFVFMNYAHSDNSACIFVQTNKLKPEPKI